METVERGSPGAIHVPTVSAVYFDPPMASTGDHPHQNAATTMP